MKQKLRIMMMMNTRETTKRVAENRIKVETEDPNY